MIEFFKGFWQYATTLEWWQSAIIIISIVFITIVGKFWTKVITWIGDRFSKQDSMETLQYRMFWGLINDAINIRAKDEVRRSFKENGFSEMEGNDFNQYVKNQTKTIMSLIKNHIINLYPHNCKSVKIKMDDIINYVKGNEHNFDKVIEEIYQEAKRMKIQDRQLLNKIDIEFEKDINSFVESKKQNGECINCFGILFGKREIVENKKSQIKTLKSQMNFAEQKLTEIQSDFISYYSESINK